MKKIVAAIFITFFISSICTASNSVRVIYSFGKIEILKSGESEWQFLTKETPLLPSDIIRMPPISLLRLKDSDDNSLPVFSGSCELTVTKLVNHGKQYLKEKKGKHIGSSFNSRPAVDILPTGARVDNVLNSKEKKTGHQAQTVLLKKDLEKFLKTIPDEMKEYATQKVVHSQFFEDRYPNRNISYARHLFMTLDKVIEDHVLPIDYIQKNIGDQLKKAILYSQLLESVGVKSNLDFEDGKPLIVFDTGLPKNKIKKVTVNRNLVSPRNGNLWISVSMEPADTFILAWYKGSESTTPP